MFSFKLNYVLIPLYSIIIQWMGGSFSDSNSLWYQNLIKPWYTPPGWVFGVVWTTIFALATLSALLFWNKCRHAKDFWFIISLFVVNSVLNVGWCYIFFVQHAIGFALLDAVLLEISVVALMIALWRHSKVASLLLLPYAVWVCFAIVLNYKLWILNT